MYLIENVEFCKKEKYIVKMPGEFKYNDHKLTAPKVYQNRNWIILPTDCFETADIVKSKKFNKIADTICEHLSKKWLLLIVNYPPKDKKKVDETLTFHLNLTLASKCIYMFAEKMVLNHGITNAKNVVKTIGIVHLLDKPMPSIDFWIDLVMPYSPAKCVVIGDKIDRTIEEGYSHRLFTYNVYAYMKKIYSGAINPEFDIDTYDLNFKKIEHKWQSVKKSDVFVGLQKKTKGESVSEIVSAIDKYNIVFIFGPPGSGKTRLVNELTRYFPNHEVKMPYDLSIFKKFDKSSTRELKTIVKQYSLDESKKYIIEIADAEICKLPAVAKFYKAFVIQIVTPGWEYGYFFGGYTKKDFNSYILKLNKYCPNISRTYTHSIDFKKNSFEYWKMIIS